MRAPKPAYTLDEQVALLIQRGLGIADLEAARRFLYDANYYRFSGYARQYQRDTRNGDDAFIAGATFDAVQEMFDLDVEFARLLGDGLAVVERCLRSRYAYHVAHQCGDTGFYLQPDAYLDVMKDRDKFLDRLTSELLRSPSLTVARYREADNLSALPIWVAIEQMSFGSVSTMLQYLADPYSRDAVANSLGEKRITFASTVHSLATFRNRCAHHGQIWHRTLAIQTPNVRKDRQRHPPYNPQGPYTALLAMTRLLKQLPSGTERIDALNQFLNRSPIAYLDGIRNPEAK